MVEGGTVIVSRLVDTIVNVDVEVLEGLVVVILALRSVESQRWDELDNQEEIRYRVEQKLDHSQIL